MRRWGKGAKYWRCAGVCVPFKKEGKRGDAERGEEAAVGEKGVDESSVIEH